MGQHRATATIDLCLSCELPSCIEGDYWCLHTASKRVGLLATKETLEHEQFQLKVLTTHAQIKKARRTAAIKANKERRLAEIRKKWSVSPKRIHDRERWRKSKRRANDSSNTI